MLGWNKEGQWGLGQGNEGNHECFFLFFYHVLSAL